jgi:hypothetical protein
MFRPIRTLFLIAIAFVTGMLFERFQESERCTAASGTMVSGLCRGAIQ